MSCVCLGGVGGSGGYGGSSMGVGGGGARLVREAENGWRRLAE